MIKPAHNLVFTPINVSQSGFLETEAPGTLFSGAFGAGKTVALCAKGLRLSLDYPKNFGLLCRKTRTSMTHTTLRTWWDKVCPKELVANYNKSDNLVTLHNGSQVVFGGLDDSTKIGSMELGWAGIDEAIETTEEDWNMLVGRLRHPGVPHQIFAATNPGPPAHYLHRLFFEQGRPGYQVFQAGSLDNPELPKDYVASLQAYTGTYYDRNVLGLWVGMEGLVYSSFDDRVCRKPRFKIPKNADPPWLIYAGHDFGSANPAAIFYAQNPGTAELFACWEYLPGKGRSTYQHVQEFKRITEGYNVIKRNGGSHQEDEIRQGYTAQGWPISEPFLSNDVKAGIQRVFNMHSLNKIFVFDDLTNYLREKLSYAYVKPGSPDPDIIESRHRFHLMDAERSILSDFSPESVGDQTKTEIHRLGNPIVRKYAGFS